MSHLLWLGIDFGTSSVKALLVDSAGVVRQRGRSSYGTTRDGHGAAEQSPHAYLDGLRAAIRQCGPAARDVAGIGLVGQTPTCIFVDAAGEPTRPALTWQDSRAKVEARELANRFGDATALLGVDLPWDPSYPPAKLLWLARHEPATVSDTRWVLQPKDYAGLQLTDVAGCDPWSSKGLINIASREPAFELLDAVGWDSRVVPPAGDAWSPLGSVSGAGAGAFGLREGTPVTVGWSDALAGMLAVGVFGHETAFVLSGTSDIVGISSRREPAAAEGLLVIPSTSAPLPVVYGPTQSSGASLTWLATAMGRTPDELVSLAATAVSDGAEPTFVPYLAGERAPVWRPDIRGLFLGLDATHGPGELAAAVLQGVGMTARHVLEAAERVTGTRSRSVVIAGRSASAPAWRTARLRTLGRPIELLEEPDISSLGAAMLAVRAAGGTKEDASRLRGTTITLEPTPDDVEAAGHAYARYLRASQTSIDWSVSQ